MYKKTGRLVAALLSVLCLASSAFCTASAASVDQVPYESYTYWENISDTRKAVYNRPMYETGCVLGAADFGVKAYTAVNDVCTDRDRHVYILDNAARITVLDRNYRFLYEIGAVTAADGTEYDYTGAQSLYVHSDGTIFICDTDNARVLRVDSNGTLRDIYVLPESPLIPEDFTFKPLKAVMDSHDYLYVLSDGSYYGALLYAPDKSFTGFYGANNVTTNIATAIKSVFERVFTNNVKKSASARNLPYSFVDIVIDHNDFIYTATGKTSTYSRKGQIKKLNPGTGNNILNSEDTDFTDDGFNTTFNNGTQIEQDIVGLEVTDTGFVYCVESQFGRVYLYDRSCRMLTAFGGGMGSGVQKGTFSAANALTLNGTDVIVSDKLKNTITVFTITDYGKQVMDLIDITLDGKYTEAEQGWQRVLAQDNNFQPAYSGLARASLNAGNYKESMELAKKGYDRETYQLAFEFYRKNLLRQYFWVLFLAAVVILGGLIAFFIISSKRKITLIKSRQLRRMFRTLAHPVLTFDEIKEKKQGSITISVVLIVLFYITAVIQVLGGGFLFTQYDPVNFNSVWVLVRSAGLVVLWVLSNWMITTLMQGKGTLREILIVTSYSLLPILIERFLRLILTNVLLPSEAMFLSGFDALAIGYTFLLMIIGLIKIHDFSMGRLIGSSALSVGWLSVLVFLMVLVGMLIQQIGGFVLTVLLELIS